MAAAAPGRDGEAARSAGPGFDMVRLGLSVAVVLIHSVRVIDYSDDVFDGPVHPLYAAVLPLFFALSGFLVMGSALRLRDLRAFVAFRVLRIYPALLTVVLASVFVLGLATTTLSPHDYLTDRLTWGYFRNMLGGTSLRLPGVFTDHASLAVNANIWTLRPELRAYVVVCLLIVTRIAYSRRWMTVAWAVATVLGTALNLWRGSFELGYHFSGDVLMYCFLTGSTAYHWRDRIPTSTPLFVAAAVAAYVLLAIPHTPLISQIPLTYVMIWLGRQPLHRPAFFAGGDFSYGIYLYAYPLQQLLVGFVPGLTWWMLFPLSLLVVAPVAVASWFFIEKPALRLKRVLLNGGRPLPASTTEP